MRLSLTVAAAIALLAAGCGRERRPITSVQRNLEPAKAFKTFPLYFLGGTYRGLPMTDDGSASVASYSPQAQIAFAYGHCAPEPREEHQTCHPPVEVKNYGCAYTLRGWVPRRTVSLRGAHARIYYDYGAFYDVRIATGRTTVVIHAKDERAALAIARSLRSVDGQVSPTSPFPPPVRLTPRLQTRLCGRWG